MARADFNPVAKVYDAGRSLPEETMDDWRAAIAQHLARPLARPGLDLGCGTGRFTSALVEWFGVEIVGVDPAREMLAVAASSTKHRGVSHILGRAEDLPLQDNSFSFSWLSTVIHHVDVLLAARELRRVLAPGGTVLVRSWFPGRGDVTHFRYFPRAKQIADTFPTIEAVEAALAGQDFALLSVESVKQMSAPSLRQFCERVRTRADTTLLGLTDVEFAEGMRALEDDAARETVPEPVFSYLDLLVFR
jgi:ubiquinone/menaquinone biosynthesis C-methylase UbiE